MVRDILRFNKESIADYEQGALDDGILLGEYLQKNRYGQMFIEKYLIPMGAAIWSSGLDAMLDVPALFFVRFFKNHGLLSVTDRPQWRTIVGGSKSYIKPLTENFRSCVQLASKITSVRRDTSAEKVHIVLEGGDVQEFDAVVFACHSDQALALLGSSWNYRLSNQASDDVLAKLTYNMNILQGLESHIPFCVSLNQNDEIDKKAIIGQYQYAHPIFNVESVSAQNQWHKIAGVNNTWFCGAYWRNGFHEDGVVSALNVIESMDRLLLSGN